MSGSERTGWMSQLRERGVLRVATSYAVIAWLTLQIASVIFDPIGVPKWVLTALIIAAAIGFPIAVALAWFLEIGEHGVARDTAGEGVPRPTARGLRHYADAVVIGILLIAVVVLLVRQSDLGKQKPPENPAIAVLPFDNLSGDPDQEYFSDGLAEEVLDRLGRVPGLRVIARSSSFGFKGRDVDAKTIAEKLGVTTLLEGSVRRDGQRLKLSARLIDGVTGQQVWSGSFDREIQDIFAVQAELAGAIVHAIVPAAKGSPVENARAPTADLNAYDLYLAARGQLVLRTPEGIQKSVDLAEQVVHLDPNFARGQAHLANSLLFLATLLGEQSPGESSALLRRAEAAAHQALALDPDLSEAHGAYANLLRQTGRPGAEEQYKRALELNPNNASTWHDYAVFLGNVANRQEESSRATERALELDPRQPTTWANYLTRVAPQGRERFEKELARAIRMVGDMPGALDRFPVMIWAQDRVDYRQQFARLIPTYQQSPGALDSLTLPGAVMTGFPVEILLAGLAKQQWPHEGNASLWVNWYRAWHPVDLERAARALPEQGRAARGVDYQKVRLFLLAEVAGRQGDWAKLERIFGELRKRAGDEDRHVRSVMAFWLAIQGRYEEAARSLAIAEPFEQVRLPFVLGGDTSWGLLDAAKVRILRGTGRTEEADRYATALLENLRAEWRKAGTTCNYQVWAPSPTRYASLAANEGLKKEAVAALNLAMRCGDLPFGFWPELPWFQSLEGYAPYDELLRERQRRVETIRNELLELEASAADPAQQRK